MAEEEESSNFGKSSSRKFQNKQKKVPQRGLGVAQLEKIRIEEQRKKAATSSPPRSVSQAAAVSSESDAPEIGGRHPTAVLLPPRPKLWNSSDFGTENDAVFPMPAPLPRIHNYLNHPSLLNLPSATSAPSSSSPMNFHMEPPSNQIYQSNFFPLPSDIDKMVGIKRPCPFPSDNSPAPHLRSNIANSVHKLNEPSRGSESKYSFELGSSNLREVVSCSTRNPESNPSKSPKRSTIFSEVLTLATPSTRKSPKFVEPPTSVSFKNYSFHDLQNQTYLGEPTFQLGPNRADRHQQYYTFFPPTKVKESRANPSLKIANGEPKEYIDLNLKL